MNTFIKSGDAEGYRTMITKGATRLAATPHFAPHNLAPPSDMGRDCWTQQCTHAWTPILAAAIQKRDVRVGQGGTRPAYCTVGMILPDVITPRLRQRTIASFASCVKENAKIKK